MANACCNCCTKESGTTVTVQMGKPVPPGMNRGNPVVAITTPFPRVAPSAQELLFRLQPMKDEDDKVNKVSVAIMLPHTAEKSDSKK